MDNLKRLQNLALKLILFLVWFDFMCFAVILAGNIFGWSFFNEKIASTFFTLFGISLGALAALVGLHIVLALSIISSSISSLAKEQVTDLASSKDKKGFRNLIVVSVAIIFLIVGYQGIVERNVAKHKVKKVESHIANLAQSSLVSKLITLIDNDDKINSLYFLRDEILLSSEEYRSINLLIPRFGQEGQVFYQITPWDFDSKDETSISKSLKRVFVPDEEDRNKFSKMLKAKEPFITLTSYAIKAYYPVVQNAEIKLIILLDTSRNISSDYLMSRSKWSGSS